MMNTSSNRLGGGVDPHEAENLASAEQIDDFNYLFFPENQIVARNPRLEIRGGGVHQRSSAGAPSAAMIPTNLGR